MPEPMKKKLFFAITKVDEAKREVHGRITEEVVDKSQEIFDYDTSKAYFAKWSDGIAKATGGKSYGNVRLMHQPVAVGKLLELIFDDAAKAIDCVCKVTDDKAWNDVLEGVLTGFSMGGAYVKRWADKALKGVTRFTADPAEVSLVDNPCVPTAHFSVIKANGMTEEVPFKIWEPTVAEVAAEAEVIAKAKGGAWGDHMDAAKASLIEKRSGLIDPDAPEPEPVAEEPTEAEKAAGAAPLAPDDPAVNESPADEAAAAAADAANTLGNTAATEKGAAAEVDWNINQVFRCEVDGSVHASKAEAKKHVEALKALETTGPDVLAAAIAKAKAAAEAPATEATTAPVFKNTDELEALSKVLTQIEKDHAPTILAKGLYTVSWLARLLSELASLQRDTVWEAQSEGDGSAMPATLAALVGGIGQAVCDMAREEVAELISDMKDGDGNVIEFVLVDSDAAMVECAAAAITAIKADTALLEKAGARHSKGDMAKLQGAHDHLTALGAKCDAGNVDKTVLDELAKAAPVAEENVRLKKMIEDALPQIEALGETVAKAVGDLAKANEKIAELEKQPAPMPPIQGRIAGKTHDTAIPGQDEVSPLGAAQVVKGLIEQLGMDQVRDLVMTAALAQPMPLVMRGGAGDS